MGVLVDRAIRRRLSGSFVRNEVRMDARMRLSGGCLAGVTRVRVIRIIGSSASANIVRS